MEFPWKREWFIVRRKATCGEPIEPADKDGDIVLLEEIGHAPGIIVRRR